MALPAAMVMSGLPHEQFPDDLLDIYQHGRILLSNPVSPTPTRPSSTTSSCSTHSSVATETNSNYCPHHIQIPPRPGGTTSTPNTHVRRPPRITRVSSADSGFFANSDNSRTNIRKLTYYLDLIQKLEDQFLCRSSPESCPSPPQVKEKELKIEYQNRDLLDLGSNINSDWPMQPASLNDQESDKLLRYRPNPKMIKCPLDDCGFEFPQF